MKFSVLCPELRAGASQKSLKYDITKGQTLEQHIANIHRSLDLVGVELSRPPSSYALQVADRKGEPLLLDDGVQFLFEDGMVDGCLQTIADVAKRQRLRDLSVLLVPTPLVRAQELIAGLSHGDTVKESAYKLRSCLQVRVSSSLWRRMCGFSYRMLSMATFAACCAGGFRGVAGLAGRPSAARPRIATSAYMCSGRAVAQALRRARWAEQASGGASLLQRKCTLVHNSGTPHHTQLVFFSPHRYVVIRQFYGSRARLSFPLLTDPELVKKHGPTSVPMIYSLLSGAQVLSASRFVVDVLRLALSVEGGYELVEEAAKTYASSRLLQGSLADMSFTSVFLIISSLRWCRFSSLKTSTPGSVECASLPPCCRRPQQTPGHGSLWP